MAAHAKCPLHIAGIGILWLGAKKIQYQVNPFFSLLITLITLTIVFTS
jgi:hypothetical protein